MAYSPERCYRRGIAKPDGADLKFTYAHPPADHGDILGHIARVSQNARTTWFGLLGLLAFVGVTLLGHKDADFFAYGAETQLPLIGIKVPVKAFFTGDRRPDAVRR